eukprot:456101_1
MLKTISNNILNDEFDNKIGAPPLPSTNISINTLSLQSDDEKSETTTNKSFMSMLAGTDRSHSQSSSPVPQINSKVRPYHSKLNKKSYSPPPQKSYDNKSSSRSPKRRQSLSSVSSQSASEILNLTNRNSDSPQMNQINGDSNGYQNGYQNDHNFSMSSSRPYKASSKFAIHRNSLHRSQNNVIQEPSAFNFNNGISPKSTNRRSFGHKSIDESLDHISPDTITSSRSKSNPNILDDGNSKIIKYGTSTRTKPPEPKIHFIRRARASSFESNNDKLISSKQAYIRQKSQNVHIDEEEKINLGGINLDGSNIDDIVNDLKNNNKPNIHTKEKEVTHLKLKPDESFNDKTLTPHTKIRKRVQKFADAMDNKLKKATSPDSRNVKSNSFHFPSTEKQSLPSTAPTFRHSAITDPALSSIDIKPNKLTLKSSTSNVINGHSSSQNSPKKNMTRSFLQRHHSLGSPMEFSKTEPSSPLPSFSLLSSKSNSKSIASDPQKLIENLKQIAINEDINNHHHHPHIEDNGNKPRSHLLYTRTATPTQNNENNILKEEDENDEIEILDEIDEGEEEEEESNDGSIIRHNDSGDDDVNNNGLSLNKQQINEEEEE